jgi:hypothetical protein
VNSCCFCHSFYPQSIGKRQRIPVREEIDEGDEEGDDDEFCDAVEEFDDEEMTHTDSDEGSPPDFLVGKAYQAPKPRRNPVPPEKKARRAHTQSVSWMQRTGCFIL